MVINVKALYIWLFIIITLLLIAPIYAQAYLPTLFMIMLYSIIAQSWNILAGYTGQISLGSAAFFGIGSYTTALLWLQGIDPIVSIFLSGIITTVLSSIIIPTFRLRGIYFAMGTLFLGEIAKSFILYFDKFTGGAGGLHLPLPSIYDPTPYFYFSSVIALVLTSLSYMVRKSNIGLAFIAIREDEDAAKALGVNPLKFKVIALFLNTFFIGVGGGLYAWYHKYIDPYTVFSVNWSVEPVFMAIIGGVGTLFGPWVGAIIMVILVRTFAGLAELSFLVFGISLIVIIRFFPLGIIGTLMLRLPRVGSRTI
jgi:branched-chain amino acid transport system permease protein